MGNECTAAAAIENLRELSPDIVIHGISWKPHDTARRHGIESFAIKGRIGKIAVEVTALPAPTRTDGESPRSLKASRLYRAARTLLSPVLELATIRNMRRCLKNIDLLVFAGTGPVTDIWGGVRLFPFRIFLWAYLARSCSTKVAFVSIGAGPIDGAISKRLFASAFSRAVYRSFRDEDSKRVIESLGITGDNHVFPDLVFGLSVPDSAMDLARKPQEDIVVMGIPYRKPGWWYKPDPAAYDCYLDSMARFVVWLLEEGRNVRLLGTHQSMDSVFIEDLQEKMGALRRTRNGCLTVESTSDYEQLMNQLAQARLVVTPRFHGVVFSYLLGKPVLAVSYHPKISELMRNFGQEDSCIEIEQVAFDELRDMFSRLEASHSEVSSKITETCKGYGGQLKEQYQVLLRL